MERVEVPSTSRSLKKMGVRGNQYPWMATTLGDVTRVKTHCFKLDKRVEIIGVVFTVSLRNVNQLTMTRLKG